MSLFTKYIDAVAAFERGKIDAVTLRVAPPAKSVDELAAEAESLFNMLVDGRLQRQAAATQAATVAAATQASTAAQNQALRGML
ncbi:hypothetical protein E3O45_05920 [Cryobacterium sp. TMS1-20-1]|uniref:hypothetical protein n=1 Tax=Cryobacterium sp. TMS1-20-1 TaxID=1259223 RepID=UPI00106C3B95|nr:hypothetical protein [Cryobacterium sp. TMS1-20-1]TFC78149.1 hypothetical protein E3O45_05920 [Cryobacterium sp. TMS1-20-1]